MMETPTGSWNKSRERLDFTCFRGPWAVRCLYPEVPLSSVPPPHKQPPPVWFRGGCQQLPVRAAPTEKTCLFSIPCPGLDTPGLMALVWILCCVP